MTVYPIEKLTWFAPTRVLCIEASDLGRGGGFSTLYPDACDVGLSIRGKYGKTVTFYLAEEHVRDGEITHWTLLPTPESLRCVPTLSGVRLEVFND